MSKLMNRKDTFDHIIYLLDTGFAVDLYDFLQEQKIAHADMVIKAEYVDLAAKYEEFDGDEGIYTSLDDNESEVVTGEKLALLANFVADKTSNEIYKQQQERNKS